jgi:hypothetical protein
MKGVLGRATAANQHAALQRIDSAGASILLQCFAFLYKDQEPSDQAVNVVDHDQSGGSLPYKQEFQQQQKYGRYHVASDSRSSHFWIAILVEPSVP